MIVSDVENTLHSFIFNKIRLDTKWFPHVSAAYPQTLRLIITGYTKRPPSNIWTKCVRKFACVSVCCLLCVYVCSNWRIKCFSIFYYSIDFYALSTRCIIQAQEEKRRQERHRQQRIAKKRQSKKPKGKRKLFN